MCTPVAEVRRCHSARRGRGRGRRAARPRPRERATGVRRAESEAREPETRDRAPAGARWTRSRRFALGAGPRGAAAGGPWAGRPPRGAAERESPVHFSVFSLSRSEIFFDLSTPFIRVARCRHLDSIIHAAHGRHKVARRAGVEWRHSRPSPSPCMAVHDEPHDGSIYVSKTAEATRSHLTNVALPRPRAAGPAASRQASRGRQQARARCPSSPRAPSRHPPCPC